ncbi:toll/interleukin-1 receptor domain-containing protein [Variovorax sp. dw_308]|uniref:toll/interleukin-1 receptor domain-containing protein n=1 Tax=Variovorax sp. dw_308 TaxID=2721546 RepID=UPI001C44E18A|nr:toll/interleukin-1 receptor domain-containing protein [Variovorax sp. dw_308]
MSRIFLSYRRVDEHYVGRVYDRLEDKFGEKNMFRDIDSMSPGTDFRAEIEKALGSTQVLVAIIGPGWLNAADAAGNRRLEDVNDFVRLELETAIRRKIPLIPVCVGGAVMPQANELPQTLAELSFRNAIPVRSGADFKHDIDRLIGAITASLPSKRIGVPKTPIALVLLGLVVSAALYWHLRQPVPEPAPGPTLSANPPPLPEPSVPAPSQNMDGVPTTLSMNNQVVRDSKTGRVWARDIFQLGTTKELLKASAAGTATRSQDLAAIDAKAKALLLDGLTNWHLASEEEMQDLKAIDGSALFRAFATRQIPGGATNVMGIHRASDGGMKVWGYQYSNYLQGPYDNAWAEGNDLGVWIAHGPVKQLKDEAGTQVVPSTPERRTEKRLEPLLTGLMASKGGAITGREEKVADGFVGNLDADDRRAIYVYSLKPLGPGALVQAEVTLAPQQSSGTGTISVSLYESTGVFRPEQGGDWQPVNLAEPLTWDGLHQVRLTLPEHIMRNAFNTGSLLGLHFKYTGKGDVRFKAPSLVITFIKTEDLLIKR